MAPTLDAVLGQQATSGGSLTLTTSAAAASNSLICVGIGYFTSVTATMSFTGTGGLTWSVAGSPVVSGSLHIYLYWAYAASGLASSTALTITASAGTNDMLAGAVSFLGINSAGTFVAANGAAASSTAWSTASMGAGAGNLMVSAAFEDGSGTATSTTTAPSLEAIDFNSAGQSEAFTMAYDLNASATDSIAGTWSTSVSHVCAGGAFLASAGAALTPPELTMAPRIPSY